MIGIDTNVLARVFVDDSPLQTRQALRFLSTLSDQESGFVSLVVLVELAWVLKRSYGFSPEAVIAAIETLFESANIEIERFEIAQAAVQAARDTQTDIADNLIAMAALAAGASKIATFDRNVAKRIPGMDVLA